MSESAIPTPEFQILNNFLGFGNPKGKYWFIGLEEAEEWGKDSSADQENFERYKTRIIPHEPGDMARIETQTNRNGRRLTPIYDIMSRIVLLSELGTDNDFTRYRNEKLFMRAGETFQANLFPLGKKSLSTWPNETYAPLFGFKNKAHYLKYVKETRLGADGTLSDQWRRHDHQKVTICFGKAEWPTFRTTLGLNTTHQVSTDWYQVFPSQKVILCPFLCYRHNCLGGQVAEVPRVHIIAEEVKKCLGAYK